MGSAHEDFNRAEKTRKLTDTFVTHAQGALTDKDQRFIKRLKMTPEEFFVIMAKEAEQELWDELAKHHGISKPSERTIKGVILLLEHRAKLRLPADPLEGLPR